MCGLPASGKTHWVKEYVKENVDKKYTLLGNTHLLEKMTVCIKSADLKFYSLILKILGFIYFLFQEKHFPIKYNVLYRFLEINTP